MVKILFVDIDGTLTETISGHAFKQSPTDVKIIEGADKAISRFANQGWLIIGISNQGGVASGHKTSAAAIKEMQFTISLFLNLEQIYFCPDFEGKILWCVESFRAFEENTTELSSCRKPGGGMIECGLRSYNANAKLAWMVGDQSEDEQCAINAGVNFCPADVWRDKFKPGVFTHVITPAQLQFLEGVEL